jgi:hypothetical protein
MWRAQKPSSKMRAAASSLSSRQNSISRLATTKPIARINQVWTGEPSSHPGYRNSEGHQQSFLAAGFVQFLVLLYRGITLNREDAFHLGIKQTFAQDALSHHARRPRRITFTE